MNRSESWVPRVTEENEHAQQAADNLALALENSGFDVGMAFPGLRTAWDESGALGVHLGTVTRGVASDLAALLSRGAAAGVTVPLQ